MKKVLIIATALLWSTAYGAAELEDAIAKNESMRVLKLAKAGQFSASEKQKYLTLARENVEKQKPGIEPRCNVSDAGKIGYGAIAALTGSALVALTAVDGLQTIKRAIFGRGGSIISRFYEDAFCAKKYVQDPYRFSFLKALSWIALPAVGYPLGKSGFEVLKRYYKGYYALQPYQEALAIEGIIQSLETK